MLPLSRRTGCEERAQINKGGKNITKQHWRQCHGGCDADLWWSVEGIRVKDGLDHDERLRQVLPDKVVPVIGRLIWAVVEHLQEGRSPQVEHELRAEES